MNVALIFAGGVGRRMNSGTTPKQFLKLNGKEIIIYTLEHFQSHNEIDEIIIVCIKEWIPYLKKIVEFYNLNKVNIIVEGGETGQLSIYNGLKKLKETHDDNTIVLIHDGVRPLINEKLISDNIKSVKLYGSSISIASSVETVIIVEDKKIMQIEDRSKCVHAKAPQSFYLKDIYTVHKKALREKKVDFIDSATIMNYYGFSLKTVEGTDENIKITTPTDYFILRAILEKQENIKIFGI